MGDHINVLFLRSFYLEDQVFKRIFESYIPELDNIYHYKDITYNRNSISLEIQPKFEIRNEEIMMDIVNSSKTVNKLIFFFFDIGSGRICQTIIDEFKILKKYFKDDFNKIQFLFVRKNFDRELYDYIIEEIKQMISATINEHCEVSSIDLIIPNNITLEDLKTSILDRIIELKNSYEGIGNNKFIKPDLSYYGRDLVFDDSLLTALDKVDENFINQ